MSVTYHGVLEGVTLADGTYQPMPGLVLGSVLGVGLVTASSRDGLLAGDWTGPVPGASYRSIRQVWYRRKRAGYASRRWFHDLVGTSVAVIGGRVSFLAVSRVAVVCPRPPGEFICGG